VIELNVTLNVILPAGAKLEKDDECYIISHSRNKDFNYYLVDTTEEYFTILTLKYGKDCVWKR
jgi:hypothetical protein